MSASVIAHEDPFVAGLLQKTPDEIIQEAPCKGPLTALEAKNALLAREVRKSQSHDSPAFHEHVRRTGLPPEVLKRINAVHTAREWSSKVRDAVAGHLYSELGFF